MNLILLGAPGAGKGTQAEKICEKYGIPAVSTGNIIREALKNGTDMGLKAKSYIDAGKLVPDDVVIGIIKDRLSEDDCKNGFILDGFPRTIPQAEMFTKICSDVKVVNFEIAIDAVIKRLSTRRVCKSCGENFNILTLPPKVEGKCDKCGGELFQRDDDKEESIMHRMEVYHEQTEPLINFYREKGQITDIDGAIQTNDLLKEFKNLFPVK